MEPKNALIKQYHRVFELDNVELEISEDALEAISDQALLRGTGARGLRAILEEVLLDVMYDLPSRETSAAALVDRSVVPRAGCAEPRPPRATKTPERSPRRAAS